MKILLLDIDGVMVLDPHKGKDEWIHGHDPFYKPSVEALNYILSGTNCEIIMTSGWRRFFDFEKINEIFRWNGIQKAQLVSLKIEIMIIKSCLLERKLKCCDAEK